MAEDYIRYDILTQAALRGVVRTVLADAARKGLPGEHHFKITFATAAPGVRLSARMRAQFPDNMTIILQHQFWDLAVREEAFEVGLSFGGVPEKLIVPFEAVTAFFDPAVQFGLQFAPADSEQASEADAGAEPVEPPADSVQKVADEPANAETRPAPEAKAETPPGAGAEVVSLDRFRKK
jgi:uncharacterized protein